MQVDGISSASKSARHYSLNNNKNEKEEQYEPLFDYETDKKIIKATTDIMDFCKDTLEQMKLDEEKENSINSKENETPKEEENNIFKTLLEAFLGGEKENSAEEENEENSLGDKFMAAAFEVLIGRIFSNGANSKA